MADKYVRVAAREQVGEPRTGYVRKKLMDLGEGIYADVVALGGFEGDVTLTGDIVLDTFGALNNAKVTNPDAASATIPALLRGIMSMLVTLNTAIGDDSDNAGDPTVIGLLKAIQANTDPG